MGINIYRISKMGIDAAEVERLFDTPLESKTVILGKDSAKNYAYTYVLVFIMYIMVIFYGQMIATSVTSEKSNRAIEILVTSTNSDAFFMMRGIISWISCLTFRKMSGRYLLYSEFWDICSMHFSSGCSEHWSRRQKISAKALCQS